MFTTAAHNYIGTYAYTYAYINGNRFPLFENYSRIFKGLAGKFRDCFIWLVNKTNYCRYKVETHVNFIAL